MDVDIVINELFGDGDELFVEYSNGPMPFRVRSVRIFRASPSTCPNLRKHFRRWEGRPRTPPFKWGELGEEVPPHDMWLRDMDLRHEGIVALIDENIFTLPAITEDLEHTKDLLIRFAGGRSTQGRRSVKCDLIAERSEGVSSIFLITFSACV